MTSCSSSTVQSIIAPSCDLAGVCSADQRAEPLPGTAAGERGGDRGAEGREEQHTSQYTSMSVLRYALL